jgi:hypothetical protein
MGKGSKGNKEGDRGMGSDKQGEEKEIEDK